MGIGMGIGMGMSTVIGTGKGTRISPSTSFNHASRCGSAVINTATEALILIMHCAGAGIDNNISTSSVNGTSTGAGTDRASGTRLSQRCKTMVGKRRS